METNVEHTLLQFCSVNGVQYIPKRRVTSVQSNNAVVRLPECMKRKSISEEEEIRQVIQYGECWRIASAAFLDSIVIRQLFPVSLRFRRRYYWQYQQGAPYPCMVLGHVGVLKRFYDRWYGPLTDRIYQYVTEHGERGNPDSVMDALDRFNREQQWTFCLGDEKAAIVRKIVTETKPKTCLELGTFVGYSAINAARTLPEGSRYICVEADEMRAATARKMIEYAGLQDVVQVIRGFSTKVIPNLKEEFNIDTFDYVFIDHVKRLYKSDLILLEEQQLLKAGTVVVADNVIIPGAPAYVEYVRNSPKYRSEFFESVLEFTSLPDGIEKSTVVAL